jgi:hypothetical protein
MWKSMCKSTIVGMWRAFRPSPTKKSVHEWGWQDEELNNLEKHEHCSYEYCKMAWRRCRSEELTKRLQKQQNFCVAKWSFLEVIRWVVGHGIIDVAGTTSWCYRPVKKHWLRNVNNCEVSFKKYEASAFDVAEDDTMCERWEPLDSNMSRDECDSSGQDFRGFYDSKKSYCCVILLSMCLWIWASNGYKIFFLPESWCVFWSGKYGKLFIKG